MPSKSEAQKKFMRIAAHDAKFAKENGIEQSVAKHWMEEDQKKDNKEKKEKK